MRVVSLCPSLTESVFQLGRGGQLVGRTRFCVQPHGLVDAIERVGGTKNPHLDRIVELEPDLVLMNEEENRREDAAALTARGLRVLSTLPLDVPGAVATLRTLGEALFARDAAETLAAAVEARAREVAARAAGRPRRRFLYLIWQKPFMAVAPGTYVDALLATAGGVNVVPAPSPASDSRYPEVGDALFAEADRVLLSSEPFPFAERHLAALAAHTGLPPERFRLVDGERLSWHGARTLLGLPYAEEVLS